MTSAADRVCFCCGRRESQISHVRVGREGKVIAELTAGLMSWYRPTIAADHTPKP